jgi:hypothetical protein
MLAQVFRVRLAAQEPQQFVGDGLEVHALGGDQRKSGGEIETHLVTEHGERAGTRAVGLLCAAPAHVPHEIQVLLQAGTAEKLPEVSRRR